MKTKDRRAQRSRAKHGQRKAFRFPALLTVLMALALCVLAPSAGPRDNFSDMLIQSTPTPVPIATPTPEPTPVPTPAATSTPAPTKAPEQAPAQTPETEKVSEKMPEPQPTATPEPEFLLVPGEIFDPMGDGSMIKALPMDDFSGGMPALAEGFSEDRRVYQDESITVVTYQEKVNYTIYSVAEITIAHPSQLRTAIAGTENSPARSHMRALANRVNAIVAIDGDYYADRKGAYAVRQGKVLANSFASDLDLLVIDTDGNFHGILASEKEEKIAQLQGNIYQCLSFGPVLIRDGEKIDYPDDYQFGLDYLNPRAGIGQLGERKYLLVVASGRLDNSLSITAEALRDYMYEKGCVQAYNVDGGASAEMVFGGEVYSPLTPSGERGLYDIIYFASTAGME